MHFTPAPASFKATPLGSDEQVGARFSSPNTNNVAGNAFRDFRDTEVIRAVIVAMCVVFSKITHLQRGRCQSWRGMGEQVA